MPVSILCRWIDFNQSYYIAYLLQQYDLEKLPICSCFHRYFYDIKSFVAVYHIVPVAVACTVFYKKHIYKKHEVEIGQKLRKM